MSKFMGIYVKFTKTTHQTWSCHVTLASNSENFYFSPNFVLNFRKVTKFGGNWLKNKKVTGKKQTAEWKTPPPPVLIGLTNVKPYSLCDNSLHDNSDIAFFPSLRITLSLLIS